MMTQHVFSVEGTRKPSSRHALTIVTEQNHFTRLNSTLRGAGFKEHSRLSAQGGGQNAGILSLSCPRGLKLSVQF